jgi:hypothetical protein
VKIPAAVLILSILSAPSGLQPALAQEDPTFAKEQPSSAKEQPSSAQEDPTSAQEQQRMKEIIDFSDPAPTRWAIVNDGVMGGRSESSLRLTDEGTAIFAGVLSLENNGGFASTRALLDTMDLGGFTGLAVRVKGDGRSYELRLRMEPNFDGIAYRAEFGTTQGEWTEVFLPFSAFQPSFRGRVPRGAPALDLTSIRQIGFLLGDGVEGPFELEIAWIRAIRP